MAGQRPKRHHRLTKWDYLNDMDELKVALDVCTVVLEEEEVKLEIIQDIEKCINKSIRGNGLTDEL